jgi:hypothetical protein
MKKRRRGRKIIRKKRRRRRELHRHCAKYKITFFKQRREKNRKGKK